VKPDTILSLPTHPVPYAVVGSPVSHSLSPAMQQAAFDHLGIEARYYRIEADDVALERTVKYMRGALFGGWNCTLPNKVRMGELCDRRAASAVQFEAVNTVVNEGGTLVGHNTDGLGWSRALREAFDRSPGDLRILLLGAGGAARAVATQALLEKCPSLLIANRHGGRARALADSLLARFPGAGVDTVAWTQPALTAALGESDLAVNATSAGLDPALPSILPATWLRPGLLVHDTIYGPGCAKLRTEVERAGGCWSDGRGMLLHQGAAAFALWTGREAPLATMRRALDSAFSASRA
jgi:shikimate dehydrogenase